MREEKELENFILQTHEWVASRHLFKVVATHRYKSSYNRAAMVTIV
jgi:hypothetical protein